jgi:hypothetical protein
MISKAKLSSRKHQTKTNMDKDMELFIAFNERMKEKAKAERVTLTPPVDLTLSKDRSRFASDDTQIRYIWFALGRSTLQRELMEHLSLSHLLPSVQNRSLQQG